jgi:hypothetical protein
MRAKNTTWKEAEGCFYSIDNDRMSGVVSTLEANHPISPLGKYINDLSLTLITPLSANDHNARHTFSSRVLPLFSRRHTIPKWLREQPIFALDIDLN